MLVRCWGSRGSISVSGKEYIKYGGDTTCVEVVADSGEIIVIDAGTGIRRLGNHYAKEKISRVNMVFTHPHWDHLAGFPFFKLLYKKTATIDIRGPRTTQEYIKTIISRTMTSPYFPVELTDIAADVKFHSTTGQDDFSIGSVHVKTIPLNHTNTGVGYRLEENGKAFVFLTDNELGHPHPAGKSFHDYVEFSKGADLLIHDAEYKPEDYMKGWGHSTYTDAVNLAMQAGVKTIGLFHHNQDRPDDGVDEILESSQKLLKDKGAKIECVAMATDTEIKL
ncbi:MAG: MBL fold metallo-hydrolase [Deltaproteobacteria bacterium]|nr:MBL fold metallo-hydrolase [Deltaproteobacteria bacterium]